MIEARGVAKHFGRRKVLDGVDLKVGDGEIVALIGPNGAGKTTLIRILSTLLSPSSGDVLLGGQSVREDPSHFRRYIGVVGHSTYTYDDLTALENLRFFWSMNGLAAGDFDECGRGLLRRVGLAHRMNDRASVFSRGMRQRLAIARALIHSPKVLLMDEPFSSLDQKGVDIVHQLLLEERKRGCSILLVTHDLQRIHNLADRADVLDRGRVSRSFDAEAIRRGDLERGYETMSEGGIR
ncbi:MAG TPA: heme ABC exporter ATP-binding protein CcmA [Thermoplasmata archaeon]